MQLALQILGYPCYHSGLNIVANVSDTEMWDKALDAKFFGKGELFTREDWDQLLGNYSAVADLPAIAFAEDLVECYPDAKVVLVRRDIERWYKSFNESIIMNIWSPVLMLIAWFDSRFVGRLGGTAMRWIEGWFEAHSRQEMQEKARDKFEEHYAFVEKVTPSNRLLKFKLEDGWVPLCEFLNKPVPNTEFPRVNDAAALAEIVHRITRRGLKNVFRSSLKVILPILLVAIVWWVVQANL